MRRNHILIVCAAFIAILPLITHGCSCGHDFDFHIQSWLDAAQQLRHGTLQPQWIFSAAYNAGEPRFIFYPPLSWMIGAILTLLFPIASVPAIYTFLALAAAGLAMHRLTSHFVSPNAALLASVLYAANPYMLFTAYERTAYAELLAAAWLPLLFLAALRKRPTIPGIALPIALLWLTNAPAAVMGSYAFAVIVITRLVIFLLHTPQKFRHPERRVAQPKDLQDSHPQPAPRARSTTALELALTSVAGTALGLTLPAFYLIPAAYQRRFVHIAMAIIPNMRFQDNFLFHHTGDAPHDAVLHTASLLALTLLIATTATLTALYLSRNKRKPVISTEAQQHSVISTGAQQPPVISTGAQQPPVISTEAQQPPVISTEAQQPPVISTGAKRSGEIAAFPTLRPTTELSSRPEREARSGETCITPATILTVCIAFLLTPPSTAVWSHLPELAFLQFPWRLLSILAVTLALAIALLFRNTKLHATPVISLSLVAALTFVAFHNFSQGCDATDLPTIRAQLFKTHQGVDPTDEYTPTNADNDALRADDPPYWLSTNPAAYAPGTTPNPAATNPDYTFVPGAEGTISAQTPPHFTVHINPSEILILNLRDYPNWDVTVDDPNSLNRLDLPRIPRADGLIAIRPYSGGDYGVNITWHRTLDQQLGLALSALAALTYLGLIAKARSRRIELRT